MTDPKQIPYLIKLLDDDSEDIRREVTRQLLSFGPLLKEELARLPAEVFRHHAGLLGPVLVDLQRGWLRQKWQGWFSVSDDKEKLEAALSLLADFQLGAQLEYPETLSRMLDRLAVEYRLKYLENDSLQLARFLFKDCGLAGEKDEYYHPLNSNLKYVIKQKRGLPISLCCVYMLVGRRLGLTVEGYNFPGHFMASIENRGEAVLVDCFNGGSLIRRDEVTILTDSGRELMDTLPRTTDAQTIIRRVLANLIRAYHLQKDSANQQLMAELFRELEVWRGVLPENAAWAERELVGTGASFEAGQIVRHTAQGYRGIIVDGDDTCQASEEWYFGNDLQPDRDQPWYHILVDGSSTIAYAAQSHLTLEHSFRPIDHPLLNRFFDRTEDGRYIRNSTLWPK